jgi:hypothetical protein
MNSIRVKFMAIHVFKISLQGTQAASLRNTSN